MLNKPKVLILIPTFNGEKFVSETIKSCLNQTYDNLEVVVIDDGSEDNTLEVLEQFNESIEIIVNDENKGLPRNINKGVFGSDSEYFIYLGHDDILEERHVELMLSEFKGKEVAVHCNSQLIDEMGINQGLLRDDLIQERKTRNLIEELSYNNFISIVGMMHKVSAFKAVKGWDEKYQLYGEWLYYVKVSALGTIRYTRKVKANYRIHSTNISSSLFSMKKNVSFFCYKTRCRWSAFKRARKNIFFKFLWVQIKDFLRHIKNFK